MDIVFHMREVFDGDRMVVAFPAFVGDKRINCFISLEAMQDHFGLRESDPIPTFKQNRSQIEAAAERKIRKGLYEADGTIFVRSGEC